MSDRLHEIIAQIGVLHKDLLNSNKINDLLYVEETLAKSDNDVKEHYYGLLMQYYFQQNNLKNLQELLLEGFKFDLRFEDIKEAFINTKDENSVIEFFEDQVVLLKDIVVEEYLNEMYEYYENNKNLQKYLHESLRYLKNNRYICAYAYKHDELKSSNFFMNKDLLDSLKRDMPYLLK